MLRTGLVGILLVSVAAGGSADPPKRKRAKPPVWKTFPSHVFFHDAFREGLRGARPSRLGSSTTSTRSNSQPQPQASGGPKWSQFVSPETLEDEVKALQMKVQQSVTTPARFRGGGYRDVRRQFTELAVLFAVIHEYDGPVRWKKVAAIARDRFARAAANAKVTSIQAFNEAKNRKLDLEELVRGGSLTASKEVDLDNDWEQIADRGPLMQRFTGAYDEGIAIWTATPKDFHAQLVNIRREAELLQVFAEVLKKEGMEEADDDDYRAYSDQLRKATQAVLQSVELKDAEDARKAASEVGKSCVQCHDDYRA